MWGTRKAKSRSLVPPAAGLVMTALGRSADCANKRTLETEGCGTQNGQRNGCRAEARRYIKTEDHEIGDACYLTMGVETRLS